MQNISFTQPKDKYGLICFLKPYLATSLRLPSLSCLTSCHFLSPPVFFSLASPHFTPLHFTSRFVCLTSLHFMPLRFASCFICLTSCHFTPPPFIFTSLHATSLHLPFCLPHFTPLHFASHSFCLTSCHFTLLHFTSLLFATLRLTSSHPSTRPLHFAGNTSPKKYGFFRKCPIQQTRRQPASPSKEYSKESFEYLSHLQKVRTFKRFDSNFFPNLSNVLNILLTSLFLQKIQIFETFNSVESLK